MLAYKFRHLIWELNALLDIGKYDELTVEDAKESIRNGRVREMFNSFGEDIDISILEPGDWRELEEEWQRFENAIDEGRKMGIKNRGLCLLLGYALQSFQDRTR